MMDVIFIKDMRQQNNNAGRTPVLFVWPIIYILSGLLPPHPS